MRSHNLLLNNLQPLDKSGKTIRSIAVIGPLGDADVDLLTMWGAMTKPGAWRPTYMRELSVRLKLDAIDPAPLIHTVRGVGYCLRAE